MNSRSSYTYSNNPLISSDTVSYQGLPIPCLNICTGDSLTGVEATLANTICQLLEEVDMTEIVIPDCLVQLWQSRNPTILTLLQFVLNNACKQQAEIDSLQTDITTIDPLITVDYKCSGSNPCVTVGEVKLSIVLQNIVNCICDINSQLADFTDQITVLTEGLNSVNTQIADIQQFVIAQTSFNTTTSSAVQSLITKTSCLKTGIISATAFPINVSSC